MRTVITLVVLGAALVLNCEEAYASLSFDYQASIESSFNESKEVTITSDMALRTLKSDVLEFVVTLPKGTVLQVPTPAQVVNYHYRNESGSLVFSSTGFIGGIQITRSSLSSKDIQKLNSLASGLFVSASITDQLQTGLIFPALKASSPTIGFEQNYFENGKPKKNFTTSVTKRFPNTLNRPKTVSSSEKKKWTRIMKELQRVADRTRDTEKSYFIIDPEAAHQYSIDFETSGAVQKSGAWSIAVLGTATRHGFQHVPCAEFMSEVLRQAYKRAGYSHFEDFNDKNENTLSYQTGAALVTNFSAYLNKAGWVPWNPQVYIPPTGAFMMHRNGVSPSHTYMVAGDNGRFIFDNGAPQGRDLRATSQKTIELMFNGGVFFLPPGFTPKKW